MESTAAYKRDERWAPTEKKLARLAFDRAFERQCTAITQEARRMLERATAPSEVFRVQEYLTAQKRIVDGLYDYRYSRLLGFSADCYPMDGLGRKTFTVSNQKRLPGLNARQAFLLRAVFSAAQSFLQQKAGSIPILSLTASRNRCLQPRYFSVVCTETWPSRK
jgi:hypothetical protein